jgi:hypothetical protein
MATFRITYRNEIYIEADSEEEAIGKFQNLSNEELAKNSEFVEQVSIDEEED